MNFQDAAKFAIADLVTREIQQTGSITKGVLATGKAFLGVGAPAASGGGMAENAGQAAAALQALTSAALGAAGAMGKGTGSFGGLGSDNYSGSNIVIPAGAGKLGDVVNAGKFGQTGAEMEAAGKAGGAAAGVEELAAGAAAGPGGIAMAVGEAAIKFVGLTITLKDFGESIVEANRHLGQWNGQLSVATAKFDIQSIRLEQQTAHATGGTASFETEQTMSLRDEFQPIAEDLAILKNIGATVVVEIARVMTGILAAVDALVGPLLHGIDKYMSQGDFQQPMADLVDFMERTNIQFRTKDIRETVANQKRTNQVISKKVEADNRKANATASIATKVLTGNAASAGNDLAGITVDFVKSL